MRLDSSTTNYGNQYVEATLRGAVFSTKALSAFVGSFIDNILHNV
jgi:hypothetical protein